MADSILVIDEFNMVKVELLSILKNTEIKILGAKDGFEADNIISYNKTVKLMMWVINSSEIRKYEEIKQLSLNKRNIPIFVVSKFTDKKYILKAIASGAREYIARPFEKDTVLKKLSEYIEIKTNRNYIAKENFITFNLDELLSREVKAASRGKYSLSLLMITVIESDVDLDIALDLYELYELLIKFIKLKLRETDSIIYYGQNLLVVLPFCNMEGSSVVKKKVKSVLKNNISIRNLAQGYKIIYETGTYPENGKTKDLLIKFIEKKIRQVYV